MKVCTMRAFIKTLTECKQASVMISLAVRELTDNEENHNGGFCI